MNSNDFTDAELESAIALIVVLVLIFLMLLFLRNFWNWTQKRRYRSKSKSLQSALDASIHEIAIANITNDKLVRKIHLHDKEREEYTSNIRKKEAKLVEEYHNRRRELDEKEENLKYEKAFYEDSFKLKDVQAKSTRIGAHFLKNVLYKIQLELKKNNPSVFTVFGKKISIEPKDKGNQLPTDILHKIYEILDYSVATIDSKSVEMKYELKNIQYYLDVIKFIKPTVRISFIHDSDLEKFKIYPTLLFPFIENALKHGSLSKDEAEISIKLHSINEYLIYKVSNTIEKIDKHQEQKEGFGLEALQDILDTYYKEHEIKRMIEGNNYVATLKIKI